MSDNAKRIGILTYTSNFNFGTFFEAYATLLSVRNSFPNADVDVDVDVDVVNFNS